MEGGVVAFGRRTDESRPECRRFAHHRQALRRQVATAACFNTTRLTTNSSGVHAIVGRHAATDHIYGEE